MILWKRNAGLFLVTFVASAVLFVILLAAVAGAQEYTQYSPGSVGSQPQPASVSQPLTSSNTTFQLEFAVPLTGVAPLTVTFRITTGRTGCGAHVEHLEFGDGTVLKVLPESGNTCEGIIRLIQHTYTTPGTYVARLVGLSAPGYPDPSATITVVSTATPSPISAPAYTYSPSPAPVVVSAPSESSVSIQATSQSVPAGSDIAALRVQIETLLAQVAALQSQLQALQGGASSFQTAFSARSCPAVARTLSRGAGGDDVRALQRFLIAEGLLAADAATGFFGSLTERAVQQWQAQRGIVNAGMPETSGYGVVGPQTRAAIASSCR